MREERKSKSQPPALLVDGLSVAYPGNRRALEDVSFTMAAGELVVVIGPNGAGKSTLFKAIVGVLPFRAGEISIHGQDCYSSHSSVGYVPQENEIDWSFPVSVFDVVMMGRCRHIGWFRRPGRHDRDRVERILKQLNLTELAWRQISELSGGQRRRVFVARALAQEARVLVLDEPFTGVDRAAEEELVESFTLLQRQGIAILLSTHHLQTVALQADKALLLRQRLLAFSSPEQVLTRQNLRALFGGAATSYGTGAELQPAAGAP